MTGAGFPHSEISGSKRACRSPKLIAACRVLRRLSVPRHPSCALKHLTTKVAVVVHSPCRAVLHLTQQILVRSRFRVPRVPRKGGAVPLDVFRVQLSKSSGPESPDARSRGAARRAGSARPRTRRPTVAGKLVGVPGFEPGTSSLSGTRSNQLSYTPGPQDADGGAEGARTPDILVANQVL